MALPPPTLQIDLNSGIPVYRQIVDALRALLVEGSLKPGELLPPVRQLALDLGIHFNTVADAYRILAEEGWLDLKRRRGAMVVERSHPQTPDPGRSDAFRRRIRSLAAEFQASGLTQRQLARELRLLAEGFEK